MRTGPIGFIGTGRMGTPMAEHLLAAGQTLVVHDARRAAAAPLLDQGAQWADSPAEVARRAKTVITIVPASREVEAVVGAMLPVLGHEHLLIEMTSADPSSTRRLAKEVEARGARMIDAPMSGGVGGARRATLAIMIGGAVADFDRARPLLALMGKNHLPRRRHRNRPRHEDRQQRAVGRVPHGDRRGHRRGHARGHRSPACRGHHLGVVRTLGRHPPQISRIHLAGRLRLRLRDGVDGQGPAWIREAGRRGRLRAARDGRGDPLVPGGDGGNARVRRSCRGREAHRIFGRRTFMNVAFIGTGTMGAPMAANLVKKGFAVVAYDIVPAALAAAARAGATQAGSAAEAAKRAEIVVTMLPSSSHVEQAYLGPAGVLEGVMRGRLCIDMSTIEPAVSRRVAERLHEAGIRFVDAPVSGGVPRAQDGTLAIMVGGEAKDVEEARPVLAAMGANVFHVGPVGSGEVAKLCNNLIAGVAAVAVSEAFRIAEGFGVDPKILTDVIAKSSGSTWLMENMHPVPGIVAHASSTRDYAPGFMTDLMAKDLGLAVNAARALRVPVVVAPAAQQVLRLASSHGLGRKDFTSVYQFLKPSDGNAPV